MRFTARALAGIGLAGAAAFAWGTLVERNMYTLRRVNVPVLAPGAAPVRVLHISDLHMAPWQRAKQGWVRSLAELKPDLVVNTGDNLGHVRGLDGIAAGLEPFRGIPGVYVHGSNDYYGPMVKNPFRYFAGPSESQPTVTRLDIDALESFFSDELGWQNLNNTATQLVVKDTQIEFFGVDDPHQHRDRLELLAGAIDELRESSEFPSDIEAPDAAGRPSSTADSSITVGVTHAPYQRVLNAFVTQGANLIFAGHTHGGQVCVPGFGALVTNCDIPRDQVKGLSLWRHGLRAAYLNVSAGIGTSIFAPVRFACPPEATLLTLTASDPQA